MLPLKNTQTLMGSRISSMPYYYPNKRRKSIRKNVIKYIDMKKSGLKNLKLRLRLLVLPIFLLLLTLLSKTAYATVDPLAVPNNRFGIHIIQATPDESSPSAQLVNSSGGDWGYVTVLIESKDRNHDKWQEFFNDLRRRHLIPIVRLATQPEGSYWKLPYEGEEVAWADFLDSLVWPTKNRYVTIYNEPNHGQEWGNKVDASSYAKILNKTIIALKNKSQDFFVLNGGLDASSPPKPPAYEDEAVFIKEMNDAVPGIFDKLDGWASHSYPNPGFIGSPDAVGRGTIRTWYWELQQLRNLGVKKILPIFITETGWRHAEGITYDSRLPTAETVSKYYQQAFANAFSDSRVVAVTPFLLSYQEDPFDHFSFKKPTGEKQNVKILGAEFPDYYPIFQVIQDMPKIAGKPIQENRAQLTGGEIYSSIVSDESYNISLTFKNTGQSIWNDSLSPEPVQLVVIQGAKELGIEPVTIPKEIKIEPGQEYTFKISLKAPDSGTFRIVLNLFKNGKPFDTENLLFTTVVKSPVIFKIKAALKWKDDFSGNYILSVKGATGENSQNITINKSGLSNEIEAKYLLPDYTFDFTLEKPFYKPTQIKQTVYAGINTLDFGVLQPDLLSTLLNPQEFWKLTPFSK